MNITLTDIVAGVGATAWIPQVITWAYNYFSQPIITITPEKNVSLGFTQFGPIFNLRLSINVDKKDTLIDFIGVELHHQSGSKYFFEWTGMTEFFSQIKSNNGESQSIEKDIVPISLKLSTLSLVERFFRFQESEYIKTNNIQTISLFEHLDYMKKNTTNYQEDFFKTKEFENYMRFVDESFWWKAGKYTVSFSIRSPEKFKAKKTIFTFNLTQNDINNLNKNINEIKTNIEFIVKKDQDSNYEGKSSSFIWINTQLSREN